MFQHLKTEFNGSAKQRNVNHKRHYETSTGKLYPSVTTITGIFSKDSIEKWRKAVGEAKADYITITAGAIGTELHTICENYLDNIELDTIEQTHKNIIPMAHFYNIREKLDLIDNIHAQEAAIWSDKFKLAGKVDCVAEYDGVLSIIDFKTSKKEKPEDWILGYFCQATAYKEAWKERTGEDIKQIVIIMSGLDGSVTIYKKNPDDYVKELERAIALYNASLVE